MTTISLRIIEARELQKELYGATDGKGTLLLKGLLNQNITAALKFKLSKLGKQIQSEFESVEDRKRELITKYGEPVTRDNQEFIEVPQFVKDSEGNLTSETTEQYKQYTKELLELLNSEVEYRAHKVTINDLDFKTDENYPFVYEYLVEDPDQEQPQAVVQEEL